MPASPSSLTALTSLRFFAALWVVIYHFSDHLAFSLPPWLFVHFGTQAVNFFFVLSGFILAHVYGVAVAEGRFNARSFFMKRFARLYPVHLVTLAMVLGFFAAARLAGMTPGNPDRYDLGQLLPNLLLLQAWFPFTRASWNVPSWSISAEFAAYLLFPLIAARMLQGGVKSGWIWLLASTVLLIITDGIARLWLHQEALHLITMSILRIIPLFLMGMSIWRLWHQGQLRLPGWTLWISLPAALITSLLPWLCLLFFVMIIVAAADLNDRHPLCAPRLEFLGLVSFSLYMVHSPVETIVTTALKILSVPFSSPAASIAVVIGGVLLSIGASIPLYLWVEKPAQRLILARYRLAYPARQIAEAG